MFAEILELIDAVVDAGLASHEELAGCTEAEIQQLRNWAGGALPGIYEDFLRAMGRAAGRYPGDVDMLYPDVLSLRHQAEELLSDVSTQLQPEMFVFSMLNGCAFLCFDARLENPMVYRYVEGERNFQALRSLRAYFEQESREVRAR